MKQVRWKRVPGNIWKYSLQNKSLQAPFIIVYDFETMFLDIDDRSKLEVLKKDKVNHLP